MTRDNDRRLLAWLWKHRFDYQTADDTVEEQITIIRETVEGDADDLGQYGLGAHIHLTLTAVQEIAATGELIAWDTQSVTIPPFGFLPVTDSLPVTEVVIPLTGYYNIAVFLGWDSFDEGGNVKVFRNPSGENVQVWPPVDDPGVWTDTDGQIFEQEAPAIPFDAGATFGVWVDPDDASAQDLAKASLAAYLVDRTAFDDEWELFFAASSHHGVTWDGVGFWTTDPANSVSPALFERSSAGAVLNSYAQYDIGSPPVATGLVYAAGWLWATGNDNNNAKTKIDPTDGTVD
jgi:hypothetical protein